MYLLPKTTKQHYTTLSVEPSVTSVDNLKKIFYYRSSIMEQQMNILFRIISILIPDTTHIITAMLNIRDIRISTVFLCQGLRHKHYLSLT